MFCSLYPSYPASFALAGFNHQIPQVGHHLTQAWIQGLLVAPDSCNPRQFRRAEVIRISAMT